MSETRKRGRPKGSKNVQRIEAKEVPATCPGCGSTNLKVIRGSQRYQRSTQTILDGRLYEKIEYVNKSCECGRQLRIRRYLPN